METEHRQLRYPIVGVAFNQRLTSIGFTGTLPVPAI
jgi:hypothetical protein